MQLRSKRAVPGGQRRRVPRTSKIGRYKICIHFMNHLSRRRTGETRFIFHFYIRCDVSSTKRCFRGALVATRKFSAVAWPFPAQTKGG